MTPAIPALFTSTSIRPKCAATFGHHARDIRLLADVAAPVTRLAAQDDDLIDERLTLPVKQVEHGNRGALCSHTQSARPPKPQRGAGDDRDLVVQSKGQVLIAITVRPCGERV